jgi:hypothetical protein
MALLLLGVSLATIALSYRWGERLMRQRRQT